MRRPIFVLFCMMVIINFFATNLFLNKNYENYSVEISGLVSNKFNEKNYSLYKIENYLIKDYSKRLKIKPGQIIKLKGRLKFNNYKNKNFDYNKYLKSMGYKGIVEVYEYKVIGDNFVYKYLFEIKDRIIKIIKYLYKEKSKFINSIILGEKEKLSLDEKELFSKTGVSHILALSGLHVSILITLIGFSVGKINSISKFIFLSIILWSYSVMVGQSPSILRAIVCSLISYFSVFVEKRSDSINNISIIGIFLIVNNPYVIYNISFQLSFLATLSIIYFYGYINKIIKYQLICITISANILTLPLVYLYFKNISIVCIISNILVVPLLSIIIYISMLSIITLIFSAVLTQIMVDINSMIIDIIFNGLEILYNINGSYIMFKNSNKFLVILYYILISIFIIYNEISTIKEQKNELQGYHQEHE